MATNNKTHLARIIRDALGMTQAELAELLGISQATVSKYESGDLHIPQHLAAILADRCGVSETFFESKPEFVTPHGGRLLHRKRKSTGKKLVNQITAKSNILNAQFRFLLNTVELAPAISLPHAQVSENSRTPESIAQAVRVWWGMGTGPVRSVVHWLEAAGCVVHIFDFGEEGIDAICFLNKDGPPVIFANSRYPTDRLRFTLAHELGHLIMHRRIDWSAPMHDEVEDEADAFASEFLMPSNGVQMDFAMPVTIERLGVLKQKWGVAMQALLRRAWALNAISEYRYRGLQKTFSARGWRRAEPVRVVHVEEPRLLSSIIDEAQSEIAPGPQSIARIMHMNESVVNSMFGPRQHLQLTR